MEAVVSFRRLAPTRPDRPPSCIRQVGDRLTGQSPISTLGVMVVHDTPALRPSVPVLSRGRVDDATAPTGSGVARAASRVAVRRLSLEHVVWLTLIVVAAVSRFWDLSYRALMHDEAIHTYYSWLLYRGDGYVHDPLSHGPFLFHITALAYFLFGDTDAASRFAPALAGVLIVAAPWLLRGRDHLGRWGALAAGLFLLVSPSLLYYTRFIRHDPFTVLGTLLLLVAIFRFIERPERRWLILGAGMLGFLYTNHEIVYAIVAMFVALLAVALLVGPLRPLVPVLVAGGALAVVLVVVHRLSPGALGGSLPAIPWDQSGVPALRPTPENQRQFYLDLITHPLVLGVLLVVVLTVVGCWRVIRRLTLPEAHDHDADGYPIGWVEVRFRDAAPRTIGAAFRNAWRDKLGLQLGLILLVAIVATLYTTFFTNLGGLATGTFATDGSLLYWLGQQDVQRGEQPWFYFLVMAPQYEQVMLAFGLPMMALAVIRAVRAGLGRRAWTPRLTFQLFLTGWAAGIVLALSYAGEKMPWLIIHIVLPMSLLAASLVGELIDRWLARPLPARSATATRLNAGVILGRVRDGRWVVPALAIALLAAGGAWILLAGRLSTPRFVGEGNDQARMLTPGVLGDWWQLVVPPLVAVGLIGVAVWLAGATRAARGTMVALLIGVLLLQVHAGFRLVYKQGDVARDGLIYNTTTPDVTRMMSDLERLSYEVNGDLSLPIQYGDDVNWPLYWYMRDFTGSFFAADVAEGADTPIIILPSNAASGARGTLGGGYTEQQYVLRWHEPEGGIYRDFAIAPELPPGRSAWLDESDPHGVTAVLSSIWSSIRTMDDPGGQQRLWRLVFFREMPDVTIDFSYSIFIRNDLLPTYDTIHYDEAT